MLRVLRLHHATKLSFPDIDVLLTTTMHAEGQQQNLHVTDATVRALGLFQHLREKYSVTAAQFASFIGDMPSSAAGREEPFFDSLFNPSGIEPRGDSESVFTIDGTTFDPAAGSGNDAIAVRQLSQAFKADEATVRWALDRVVEAQTLTAPARSLAVVSACYRLIALPRLLGLKSAEAPILLTTLNRENPDVLRQLAGTPSLANASQTGTDVLDVIALVMNVVEWARQHKRGIAALCLPLLIPTPTQPATSWIAATNRAIAALESTEKDKSTDNEIVAVAIQQGLQLKDQALSLPLLKWTNRSSASVATAFRALGRSAKVTRAADGTKDVKACLAPDDLRLWSDLDRYAAVATLFGLSAAAVTAMVEHPAWFNLAGSAGSTLRLLDFTTVYQVSRYADWLAELPTGSDEDRAIDYLRQVHENRRLTSTQSATLLSQLTDWPRTDIEAVTRHIDSKNIADTVEDIGDIDFTMRLNDLARSSGLSIDALLDVNGLKVATNYNDFEKAAAALACRLLRTRRTYRRRDARRTMA